jgi:hypothetical protein
MCQLRISEDQQKDTGGKLRYADDCCFELASWRSKHVWHLQRHSYKTRCCHVDLVQRGMSPNSYDFHKLSNRSSGAYFPRIMTVPWRSFSASHFREHYNRSPKTHRLGVNATQFGPALTTSEYKTYFLVRESLVFSVWVWHTVKAFLFDYISSCFFSFCGSLKFLNLTLGALSQRPNNLMKLAFWDWGCKTSNSLYRFIFCS